MSLHRRLHFFLGVHLLDRVVHRHRQEGRSRLLGPGEHGVHEGRRQARPDRVVDRHEVGLRLDQGQGVGDRLEALPAAVGDLHVGDGQVGAEAATD